MYVNMALQTIREFLEYYITMRFAVAIFTFRNIFVPGMTFCTGNLSMLACRSLDLTQYSAMTSAAYLISSIFRIFDNQW